MKSSIFVSALALATSVFSAAVPQPIDQAVQKRQLESQAGVLDTLYAAVVEQTTQISTFPYTSSLPFQTYTNELLDATLAGTPNPSLLEIPTLAAAINPKFAAITAALQSATSSIKQRRSLISARQDTPADPPAETCDAQCITEKVLAIVQEIASTIREAIQKLGLAPLLSQINPLLLALSALVLGLDVLVTGLLVTVTAVVSTILGGLGLSLLLLGFA
jgi:hypothetical protein